MVEFKNQVIDSIVYGWYLKYQYIINMILILIACMLFSAINFEIVVIALLIGIAWLLFKICQKLDNIITY